MSITLKAGDVPLSAWRNIYQGASCELDSSCWTAIDASAGVVASIIARNEPVYGINTGFGKLALIRIDLPDLEKLQKNIVLSHAAGVGDAMAPAVVRLMMALKIASLAQGLSGIRRTTIAFLSAMLDRDCLPVIPAQGSVGASGDLAPLSHMTAAMLGVGEVVVAGERMLASEGLKRIGLEPCVLGAKEGLALLNGTQFSTAYALAGLFAAQDVFAGAVITGALSVDGARGSDTPFDPRIHAARRHPGQIDVAASMRGLLSGSEIRESHRLNDNRIQDPYCLRCQPQVMGACLDTLRHVAIVLEREANAVSDNPLIFSETGEALSGGNFHAEPVAFVADMLAVALCEIGSMSERRTAMLVDPALSGLPAFLTPKPGLNSGFMIPQVTAAALTSENKQMAYPASVDSIPTSANQEDHVSMAAHAARRLIPMARNAANIVGIELLAAAQACDFHQPLRSSPLLENVRASIRTRVAHLDEDRYFAPDLAAAAEMVEQGELAKAVGHENLPAYQSAGETR